MRINFNLYLITDRKLFASDDLLFSGVEEALKAGVTAVQLREKDLPTRQLLEMAYRVKELTEGYIAMLFVNDRVDIAMSVNADGVHLGQASIPVHAVRKIAGDKFLIGASTHSPAEATAAEKEGADFITFGPVYQTASKLKYGEPVGIESLRRTVSDLAIPVFGIGGIKPDNAEEVMSTGASGIALISGILGAGNIKDASEKYLGLIEKANKKK